MAVERHDIQWENVAPYLLGALVDVEERAFESHLEECHVCRDEVERLRPAVYALPRSVEPMEAPASLKASLMQAVEADVREREGRSRPGLFARLRERMGEAARSALGGGRPRAALLAGAAVLVVGAALGFAATRAVLQDDTQTLSAAVDRERIPSGGGRLEIREGKDEGAVLRVTGMPELTPGRTYQVWVQRGDAYIPQDSLFTVGEDGMGSAVVTDDLEGADAVAVTRERAGGARAPGEKPILTVEL
jgi:hypothetical protein